MASRKDAQLEIVPQREAIAGLRRDDLRLVANVLETLACASIQADTSSAAAAGTKTRAGGSPASFRREA